MPPLQLVGINKHEGPTNISVPIYHRLSEEFRRCIREQIWRPGLPIPTESELAATFGVAVGTVRKATDQLVAGNLLQRFQGRGTFVRRPSFTASMFRFFRFEDKDGGQRVPKARILNREILDAPAEVAAKLMLKRGSKVIRLDRLRLFGEHPVLSEEIWLSRVRFGAIATMAVESFGDLLYPLYEESSKQLVASAEETLTVDIATVSDHELLGLDVGAAIVAIDRLAHNLDGEPIEWRHTRGRADKFRYRVDIH